MERFFTYLDENGIKVENVTIIDGIKEILRIKIQGISYPIIFTIHRNDKTNLVEEIYIFTGIKSVTINSNENLVKFINTLKE